MSSVKIDQPTAQDAAAPSATAETSRKEPLVVRELSTMQLFEPKPEPKQEPAKPDAPKPETLGLGMGKADIVSNHPELRHNNQETSTGTAVPVAKAVAANVNFAKGNIELSDHMVSLTPKKKTALDAELERFLALHPEFGAHIRIAEEIAILQKAQDTQGKQGLSAGALVAALERVATNLQGDQLPIELVIPQAVAGLCKLFDVVAHEIEIEPEAAQKLIFLTLFQPLNQALEVNLKLLEQKAARAALLAKRMAEQAASSNSTPQELVKTEPIRDDYQAKRNAQAVELREEGGTAQLETQRQRREEDQKVKETKQLEELSEMARRLAKERAKTSGEAEPQSLALERRTLTETLALSANSELGLASPLASGASNALEQKVFLEEYTRQVIARAEFEETARKIYELAVHAAVLRGTYAATESKLELDTYLEQHRTVLIRMPDAEQRLQDIFKTAEAEGLKRREKVAQATTELVRERGDDAILSRFNSLSQSDLYFVAIQYQERTGISLIQALNEKMDGAELNTALRILAGRDASVRAPDSLRLADLSRVDVEAVRTMVQPKTEPEIITAIHEHLKSGNLTEAVILLQQSELVGADLARIEKAHGFSSTLALMRASRLGEFCDVLESGQTLGVNQVASVGSYELNELAAALGTLQAAPDADATRISESEKDLDRRRAILALFDHEFRNPSYAQLIQQSTEQARYTATVKNLQRLSSDEMFLRGYATKDNQLAQQRHRAAQGQLLQYQSNHEVYLNSAPVLITATKAAKEDGSAHGLARQAEVQSYFNLLVGEKKSDEFLAGMRDKVFGNRDTQFVSDLRALAAINGHTLESLIQDRFTSWWSPVEAQRKITECRALLSGDLVTASAARCALLLQEGKGDELAALYSQIRAQSGTDSASVFAQIENKFAAEYADKFVKYDGGPDRGPIMCATLTDVVEKRLDRDAQDKLAAVRLGGVEGQITLDAITLHQALQDGIISHNISQATQYLSSIKNEYGELDRERIRAILSRFTELYEKSDPSSVAIVLGANAKDNPEWGMWRAAMRGDDAELRVQQTLSKDFDSMLAALEKPEQLRRWESLLSNPTKMSQIQFQAEVRDGVVVTSSEEVRAKFIAGIHAASVRWEASNQALQQRIVERTGKSLQDFHTAAATTVTTDEFGNTFENVNKLQVTLLGGARENHELSDAMRLWRNMDGMGTTSEKEILDIVAKAAREGRIKEVSKELKDISGSDLTEWIRPTGWLSFGELSGDDRFWVELAMRGPPKDAQEAFAQAKMLTEYTESASWMKYVPEFVSRTEKEKATYLQGLQDFSLAGSSINGVWQAIEVGERGVAYLMGSVTKEAIVEYVRAKENAEKVFAGAAAGVINAEQQAALERLQKASKSFMDRRNQVAEAAVDQATMVVVVVGGTVIVVASGGVGAAVVLTAGAGAVRIGGKAALMGQSYGHEAVALDLGKTGVDGATLAVSLAIPVGSIIQNRVGALAGEAGLTAAARATGGRGAAVAVDTTGNVLSRGAAGAGESAVVNSAVQGTQQTAQSGAVAAGTNLAASTSAPGLTGAATAAAANVGADAAAAPLVARGVTAIGSEAVASGSAQSAQQVAQQGVAAAAARAAAESAETVSSRGAVNFIGTTGQGKFDTAVYVLKNPLSWTKGQLGSLGADLKAIGNGIIHLVQSAKHLTARAVDSSGRVALGGVGGAADGAFSGGVQGFGYTAIEERTWSDGIYSGLTRSISAGIHSAPMGAMFGGAFGAAMGGVITPRTVKRGEILSHEFTQSAFKDPRINVEGRTMLLERSTAKGYLTRGDFFDAVAASRPGSNWLWRANRDLGVASRRIDGEILQATKDSAAASAFIDQPGITPEQKVQAQANLEAAQAKLAELSPQRLELDKVIDGVKAGTIKPSRYQLELWRNGQPQGQSTVVKKGFVDERIAQEKALLERTGSAALDDAARKAAELRIEGLERLQGTLKEQADYLAQRASRIADGAVAIKDRSMAAGLFKSAPKSEPSVASAAESGGVIVADIPVGQVDVVPQGSNSQGRELRLGSESAKSSMQLKAKPQKDVTGSLEDAQPSSAPDKPDVVRVEVRGVESRPNDLLINTGELIAGSDGPVTSQGRLEIETQFSKPNESAIQPQQKQLRDQSESPRSVTKNEPLSRTDQIKADAERFTELWRLSQEPGIQKELKTQLKAQMDALNKSYNRLPKGLEAEFAVAKLELALVEAQQSGSPVRLNEINRSLLEAKAKLSDLQAKENGLNGAEKSAANAPQNQDAVVASARPEAIDAPNTLSISELNARIKELRKAEQTPETKRKLAELYKELRSQVRPDADQIASRDSSDGDGSWNTYGDDDFNAGGTVDTFDGGDFPGGGYGGGGGGAAVAPSSPRSNISSGGGVRPSINNSSKVIDFGNGNNISPAPRPGGVDTVNIGNNRVGNGPRSVGNPLDPAMQMEVSAQKSATAVLDNAPLVEEFSPYDTPEIRAWKESQRPAQKQSQSAVLTRSERAARDAAIDKLFSTSIDELNVGSSTKSKDQDLVPGNDQQRNNIYESAAETGRRRAAEEMADKAASEVAEQELLVKRARQNEEIADARRKAEEVDDRFARAKRAESRSDALERAEDVPLNGVVEGDTATDAVRTIFVETMNRIFEPDHGNQTPRMHPLEEAALAARRRARAHDEGTGLQPADEPTDPGVTVLQPDPILDPSAAPQLALDPTASPISRSRTASRVRPLDEVNLNSRHQPAPYQRPLPQPHRVKSPLDTELEVMFRDQPDPNRRYLRGGPGEDGQSTTQLYPRNDYVAPKHVMPISLIEAKVRKIRDGGRPKLLRRNALGVMEEYVASINDGVIDGAERQELSIFDDRRLVSSNADS